MKGRGHTPDAGSSGGANVSTNVGTNLGTKVRTGAGTSVGIGGDEDVMRSLLGEGVALQAVNVRLYGPHGRRLMHAGHLEGPLDATFPPEAEEVRRHVRGWLVAAAALRPFHETRLQLGIEQSDGFHPDRVVFEWKVDKAPPLSSLSPSALADGAELDVDIEGYPGAALEALRVATAAVLAWRAAQARRVEIEIKTRLLKPSARPDKP